MNQLSETLVCCAISHLDGYQGSVNLSNTYSHMDIYLKNAFVALKSTKENNPGINVGLFINFDVDAIVQGIFSEEGIHIYKVPFNSFRVPSDNKWSLAFYKLCALEWAVNNLTFNYFVEIDCDVFCNGNVTDLISEAGEAIVMLSGPFTYNHPIRKQFELAYKKMYSEECRMIKWGSGLICGNLAMLKEYMIVCDEVYLKMKAHSFCGDNLLGDEYITSVAAIKTKVPIRDGKAYMNVYWTSSFYLVSTDYYYDKMVFLHLPDEKETGLIDLYDYYMNHSHFPKAEVVYKYLNLPQCNYNKLNYYFNKVRRIIQRRFGVSNHEKGINSNS